MALILTTKTIVPSLHVWQNRMDKISTSELFFYSYVQPSWICGVLQTLHELLHWQFPRFYDLIYLRSFSVCFSFFRIYVSVVSGSSKNYLRTSACWVSLMITSRICSSTELCWLHLWLLHLMFKFFAMPGSLVVKSALELHTLLLGHKRRPWNEMEVSLGDF